MTPQMIHPDVGIPEETTTVSAHELSYKDKQGLAMAWAFSALGLFLLLAGLALGAAIVFQVGFAGWLIACVLMAIVVVAVIAAANVLVLRPAR